MYKVFGENITSEEKIYTVYGIECPEARVDNISPDKEAVLKLAERFNKYELDPVHLRDAVEDFLE